MMRCTMTGLVLHCNMQAGHSHFIDKHYIAVLHCDISEMGVDNLASIDDHARAIEVMVQTERTKRT